MDMWSTLVDPAAGPLARSSAVSGLGGGGGGLDLSSAFSMGSDAATGGGGGSQYTDDQGGKHAPSGGGLGSVSPMLASLTKAEFNKMHGGEDDGPTSEDKGLALAQAGFAMAAGQSSHALTNIGQGALYGVDALQKQKQLRAIQRMREMQAEQMGLYRQGQLEQTAALRGIQQQREADAAQKNDQLAAHYAAIENQPSWRPSGGVDANGNMVMYDEKSQKTRSINAIPKSQINADVLTPPKRQPGQSDEDYYADLSDWNPGVAAQALATAEYRGAPPTTRSGKPNPVAMAANLLNPQLDTKNYNAKNKLVTDFASGKTADAQVFLDRTVNNMEPWFNSAKDLNNYGGIRTPLNAPINKTKAFFGAEEPTNYEINHGALSTEMRNVFSKSSQGNLTELQSWENKTGVGMAPNQFEGAKDTFLKLFDGQLDGLKTKWNNGDMPKKMAKADLLSDDSLQKLSEIAPDYFDKLKSEKLQLASSGAKLYKPVQNVFTSTQSADTPAQGSSGSQDQQPSQEDLEHTAKLRGITVDEVKKKLGIK